MIVSEKEKGLYQKYEVKKLSNPDKKLDCIVLEFDDRISVPAVMCWAYTMKENGYHQVFTDVCNRLKQHGQPTDDWGALKMHRVIELQVEKLANVIIAHSPAIQAGIKTADQILWFFTRWILTASLIIAFGLASLLTLIIHK